MMKKILSSILALIYLVCALLSVSSCGYNRNVMEDFFDDWQEEIDLDIAIVDDIVITTAVDLYAVAEACDLAVDALGVVRVTPGIALHHAADPADLAVRDVQAAGAHAAARDAMTAVVHNAEVVARDVILAAKAEAEEMRAGLDRVKHIAGVTAVRAQVKIA